jgi:hypothetical protein
MLGSRPPGRANRAPAPTYAARNGPPHAGSTATTSNAGSRCRATMLSEHTRSVQYAANINSQPITVSGGGWFPALSPNAHNPGTHPSPARQSTLNTRPRVSGLGDSSLHGRRQRPREFDGQNHPHVETEPPLVRWTDSLAAHPVLFALERLCGSRRPLLRRNAVRIGNEPFYGSGVHYRVIRDFNYMTLQLEPTRCGSIR